MYPWQHRSLPTMALALVIGGLLAGSLAGCATWLRQPAAGTPTAGHPVIITTRASSGQVNVPVSATASNNPADQLDAQLQTLQTELSNADTLNDLSTALPPDQAASTPVVKAPTVAPAGNVPAAAPSPTVAPSGDDQSAQIDQMLATLQAELSNTDTVPEAANP